MGALCLVGTIDMPSRMRPGKLRRGTEAVFNETLDEYGARTAIIALHPVARRR